MRFSYDSLGNAVAILYNGTEYYYMRNLQGDVIGLINKNGEWVVRYRYDVWGNILEVSGIRASTLGQDNPIRYRRYCYDAERGLYYLGSRYYSPELCRFICPDKIEILTVSPAELTDKNLYAYCDNNPLMRKDINGKFWIHAGVIGVSGVVGGVLGAFSAASTGGNVVQGFIQGMALGLVSASFGLFAKKAVLGVICSTVVGGLIDGVMQAVSNYGKNGDLESLNLNWKSIVDTGLQTGVSTAIPYMGTGAGNIIDAAETIFVWTEASIFITCADIKYTKSVENKKPDSNSYVYSNTRRTGQVPI